MKGVLERGKASPPIPERLTSLAWWSSGSPGTVDAALAWSHRRDSLAWVGQVLSQSPRVLLSLGGEMVEVIVVFPYGGHRPGGHVEGTFDPGPLVEA